MAFDWDSFDEEYGSLTEQEPTIEEDKKPFREDYSLLGEIGSGIVRGAASLTELGAEGLDALGLDTPIDEWIEEGRKEYDILKPSRSEYYDEGLLSGLRPSVFTEQVTTSLGAAAPGAAAGFLVGGPIGSIVGGLGSTLLTFGLGEGNKRYDELKEAGYSDKEALEGALITGGIEGGIEGIASGIDIATAGAGRLITQLGKQGVKATARNMLKISSKEALSKAGIILGTENFTEQLQAELGRQEDIRVGFEQNTLSLEDRAQNFITTSAMSLLFAGGAVGYSAKQKSNLKRALESDNKVIKATAANRITKELTDSGDTDLASQWKAYTDSYIKNDLPIRLDDNFVDLGNKIQDPSAVDISDITSSNPDIQKNASDVFLANAGIEGDGSINLENAKAFIFERKAKKERQEAFKGSPANKLQEQAKQEEDRKKAEVQLEEARGKEQEDPLATLERQVYVQQLRDQVQQGAEDKKKIAEGIVARETKEPVLPATAKESAQVFEEAGPTPTERRAEEVSVLEEAPLRADEIEVEQVSEAEAKAFEEVSKRYVKDNFFGNKAIEKAFTSADGKKKLEIIRLLSELEKDTNNVKSQEEIEEKVTAVEKEIAELPSGEIVGAMDTAAEDKGVGISIAATTMTPEMELERKDTLSSLGLTEEDIAETSDPEVLKESAKSEAATALLSEDWTSLRDYILGNKEKGMDGFKADSREGALIDIIANEIDRQGAKANISYLSNLLAKAKTLILPQKVNAIEGATKEDRIKWQQASAKGNQKGWHKESGKEVEITAEE